MIEEQYLAYVDEQGFENSDYVTRKDRNAYSTAITAGHIYEVISTYKSSEQQDTLVDAVLDNPQNFRAWMQDPDPRFPSGVRDPGVFGRDLRANRLGATFGITAFHNPIASPNPDPPYFAPLPR